MSSSQPSSGESATAAGVEAPAVNLERKARKEAQKALKAQQAAEKKAAKQAQPAPGSSSSKPKESHRRPQSSGEQLSRALAYFLRHGADKEGLSMRPDGYIALDDVLDRPRVKSVNMAEEPGEKRRPALEDIQQIVDTNDKKRFELLFDGTWLVRAVQGHSLSQVVELSHTPLTLTNLHLLKLQDDDDNDDADDLADEIDSHLGLQESKVEVVHGTFADAWQQILASGGLKRMSRNHIHLAKGKFGQKGVVSGMRKSANRLIFVDVRRAIADGFQFALSSNGVVLTPGKGQEGVLPVEYFTRVEDAKGNIVWTPPSSQP